MTIPDKWLPVMEVLGREKTEKLIVNGTSLEVAMQIIKYKNKLKFDLK